MYRASSGNDSVSWAAHLGGTLSNIIFEERSGSLTASLYPQGANTPQLLNKKIYSLFQVA